MNKNCISHSILNDYKILYSKLQISSDKIEKLKIKKQKYDFLLNQNKNKFLNFWLKLIINHLENKMFSTKNQIVNLQSQLNNLKFQYKNFLYYVENSNFESSMKKYL